MKVDTCSNKYRGNMYCEKDVFLEYSDNHCIAFLYGTHSTYIHTNTQTCLTFWERTFQ